MIQIRIQVEDLNIQPEIMAVLDDIAEAVPTEFRKVVDGQTASGRLYRRGAITARRTKSLETAGFANRKKTRSVVGSRFHRASAPGQFPAKDTGELYRYIRVERKGIFDRQVIFGSKHAGFAEQRRRFIDRTIELVVQRFI